MQETQAVQTSPYIAPPQAPVPDVPWTLLNYIELGAGIFLAIFLLSLIARPRTALKHWHHHFAGLELSSEDVFKQIIAEIEKRAMPDVWYGTRKFFEAGIFSARRVCLTIVFKNFDFDVCCAKFGTGYYISWWLGQHDPGFFSRIPILNNLFGINPKFESYYQIDTATMFQSGVHDAVMTVIDQITNAKGIRQLTEFERQPESGKLAMGK